MFIAPNRSRWEPRKPLKDRHASRGLGRFSYTCMTQEEDDNEHQGTRPTFAPL